MKEILEKYCFEDNECYFLVGTLFNFMLLDTYVIMFASEEEGLADGIELFHFDNAEKLEMFFKSLE